MIDFEFTPAYYFDGTGATVLLVKLTYPESQWGEEINIYATTLDGMIYYEVVDFYSNEYITQPEKSIKPLKLQELIFMAETLEVKEGTEQGQVLLTLSGIPEAESIIYPEIKKYFQEKRAHFGFI